MAPLSEAVEVAPAAPPLSARTTALLPWRYRPDVGHHHIELAGARSVGRLGVTRWPSGMGRVEDTKEALAIMAAGHDMLRALEVFLAATEEDASPLEVKKARIRARMILTGLERDVGDVRGKGPPRG